MNKNFIFEDSGDNLIFIGDFDGLYENLADPWEQSGKSGSIQGYYAYSRKCLVNCLKEINPKTIAEVGCGLGYTTSIIGDQLTECNILGIDISKVAIEKAKINFPKINFENKDIADKNLKFNTQFDVIILNQLLWYILENIDVVFKNCWENLSNDGCLVISQAFLKEEQRYGREICDGFDGLINLIKTKHSNNFFLENFQYNLSQRYLHNDGLIVLRKK